MDIYSMVPKPVLCCLDCVLGVIVRSQGEPLAKSEILSPLGPVFIKDMSVLFTVQLPMHPYQAVNYQRAKLYKTPSSGPHTA